MSDSNPDWSTLVQAAAEAAEKAYAPYSKYQVGAALLTTEGKIYCGCNVENAAYGSSICAERTAILKAVSEGDRHFEAIAIFTRNGGAPCGSCRQFMREFAPELTIILVDWKGDTRVFTLPELLPDSFGPEHLD